MPCCGQKIDKNAEDKSGKKLVTCAFSCCMFWFVLCVILATVLVFIGKHLISNSVPPTYYYNLAKPISSNIPKIGEPKYIRLPNDTRPSLYNLTLLPYLDKNYFEGFINISLEVTNPKKEIVLHSKKHTVFSVELVSANKKVFQLLSVTENLKYDVLVITPKEKIFPGKYSLTIKFRGILEKTLGGFYKSVYKYGNEWR